MDSDCQVQRQGTDEGERMPDVYGKGREDGLHRIFKIMVQFVFLRFAQILVIENRDTFCFQGRAQLMLNQVGQNPPLPGQFRPAQLKFLQGFEAVRGEAMLFFLHQTP